MRRVNANRRRKDAEYYREFIKARVKIDERGCWLWQKFIMPEPNPYGMAYAFGKNWRVHRLAYTLWIGPLPDDGRVVCHDCDVKHCCNPDHLWLGTEKQNMRDAADKGRWKARQGTHCRRGHEYTPENTKMKMQRGRPARVCIACQNLVHQNPTYIAWRREYQKRRRAEKKAAQGNPASQV
jgi:hypothetical protein